MECTGDYDESSGQLKLEEGAKWKLTNIETGEIIASEHTIEEINE
jgi:hypothetical protein